MELYKCMLYYSISQLRNLQVLDMARNRLPDNRFQQTKKLNISKHEFMALTKRYILYTSRLIFIHLILNDECLLKSSYFSIKYKITDN